MPTPIDLRFLDPRTNPALHLRTLRPTQMPAQGGGLVDRMLGISDLLGMLGDRQAARRAGLLRAGSVLLQASGPSRTPIGVGQAVGAALEEGQGAARASIEDNLSLGTMLQGVARQETLQRLLRETAGLPLDRRVELLVTNGFGEEANQLAQTAERVRPSIGTATVEHDVVLYDQATGRPVRVFQGKDDLHFSTDPNSGDLIGIDPKTGTEISRIPSVQAAGMNQNQFNRLNAIATRFASQTADLRDVTNSYRRVRAAGERLVDFYSTQPEGTVLFQDADLAGVNTNDAATLERLRRQNPPMAAALTLFSSYARMIDPGSVVREGELTLQRAQGSVAAQLRTWWERIVRGGMDRELAQAILNEADSQLNAQESSFDERRSEASTQARKVGVPEDVVTDFWSSPFDQVRQDFPHLRRQVDPFARPPPGN